MTENSQGELIKRTNNLFNALLKNPKSIFYLVGHVTRTLFNKVVKLTFEKDKVLVNLYDQLENKNFKQSNQDILPITMSFYNFKSNVDHSTLYSVGKPLSYCMLILQILDFLPNLPLFRNIVFCWWIYLLQKYIFIP